ncbi:hypothetical protein ACSQ67_017923 [Phaseolus vulgaris]
MENPHFVFQSFKTEIDFGLVTTVQCSHSAIFSLTLTPQYPILLSPQPSVSEPWRPTPRLFNSIASSRSVTLPPMLPEKLFANTSGRTSTFFTNMISVGPVTIADRSAEEAMVSIILDNFPSHAIYGEENGWRCKEKTADYVWILDPIDGTKSFITGKPVFGTLIALLQNGTPILGIIDQPVLKERWIGISGKRSTLNGQEISTRTCADLSQAYLYTTSPHLFSGDAEEAFIRVRSKVKIPLYGCDCYAYALLSSGFVDLVVESGLKPYDFLALVPVIEGAGGVITDWKGDKLFWEASPLSIATNFNVVAAGDKQIHQQALDSLQWK